jgi:hypothetical protein
MGKEFVQLHLDHMPGWEGTCEMRAMIVPGDEMGCEPKSFARA